MRLQADDDQGQERYSWVPLENIGGGGGGGGGGLGEFAGPAGGLGGGGLGLRGGGEIGGFAAKMCVPMYCARNATEPVPEASAPQAGASRGVVSSNGRGNARGALPFVSTSRGGDDACVTYTRNDRATNRTSYSYEERTLRQYRFRDRLAVLWSGALFFSISRLSFFLSLQMSSRCYYYTLLSSNQ